MPYLFVAAKVEVHDDDWWKTRFEAAGLVYSNSLTQEVRTVAQRDQGLKNLTLDMKPDLLYFVGQHIYLNMQVNDQMEEISFSCFHDSN